MAMPLHLTVKLGTYLMKQKIKRVEKYPLIMELEPLFACNLKCAGCGKIQHPASVLKQRMPVEQAVAAVEECGAPMVSIAGGEPLMHPQIHVIAAELLKRKKFVVLCTNAVLLPKHIDKFKPNKNFAWMVHLDGIGEKHDEAVSKEGVFEQAVAAIKLAKQKGFQVYTNTTVFNTETPQDLIATLDYINDELGVDRLEIAPGYAYGKAPDQDRFLGVTQTRELFSKAFADGRRKKWRFNHSQLYLDFLEGKADFECTPWGVPLYCLKGLAEALLPARRRLRRDLAGTPGDHGLGQVRPRQGPALRQLHGPLRLRAHRGPRHDGLPQGEPPRPRRLMTAGHQPEGCHRSPVAAGSWPGAGDGGCSARRTHPGPYASAVARRSSVGRLPQSLLCAPSSSGQTPAHNTRGEF